MADTHQISLLANGLIGFYSMTSFFRQTITETNLTYYFRFPTDPEKFPLFFLLPYTYTKVS